MARFKKYTSCVLFELDLSLKCLSTFFDNLDSKQISAIPHYIIDIFWHLCCHKGVIWIVRLMNIMSLECPCSGRLTRLKKWRLSQYTNTHGLHFLRTLCCKSICSSAFLWCKMPMIWRAGMREGGKPLPLALQYLIFMV